MASASKSGVEAGLFSGAAGLIPGEGRAGGAFPTCCQASATEVSGVPSAVSLLSSMALLSSCGFDTPSLPAQGGQRRQEISTGAGTSPEAPTPWYPVIHDFEPDIDTFYRDWLGIPVPERADAV
jgi:hypothetical protein